MASQEQTPPKLALGIIITLIANLFFATASALVWNFRGRFPTIQIIFIQNLVSLLCILPLALRNGLKPLKTKNLPLHLLRDLIAATTLNYTAPFFVPVVWWIWRNEKIQSTIWWSILVGFIGVALILNPSRQMFQLGFLYGLFAGIASAIALCAVRVLNLKEEPMSRTLFYYFSIGSVLSFPFALAVWVPPINNEWWLAIGIGAATAVGQILLTIAYRYGTASYLSPLGYATVIYNTIISYLAFNQRLDWHSILGTLLIIGGGTLTYLLKKKPISVISSFENPRPQKKPPL
jgi:drug/metabolite transporter (DMT)-like permease